MNTLLFLVYFLGTKEVLCQPTIDLREANQRHCPDFAFQNSHLSQVISELLDSITETKHNTGEILRRMELQTIKHEAGWPFNYPEYSDNCAWICLALRGWCRSGGSAVGKMSCYSLDLSVRNWTDAREHCSETGGHLAALETMEEFTFVEGIVRAGRSNII